MSSALGADGICFASPDPARPRADGAQGLGAVGEFDYDRCGGSVDPCDNTGEPWQVPPPVPAVAKERE